MLRLAILVALFTPACSGLIDGGPDDPPGDDDPMNPPPPTDVRIKVHDSEGPLAGLPIVFLDTNDAVVADVVTDAQGAAVAKLDRGSVTVIYKADPMQMQGASRVYTYVGAKAGDVLELAVPRVGQPTPVTVRVTVPQTEDAVPVAVYTPCGSGQGAPPIVEVSLNGCGSETDFYVSELAQDPAAFLKRATIAPTIDLSAETYRGALTTTFSVKNAPMGATASIEKRIDTDLFRPVFSTGQLPITPSQTLERAIPDLPDTEEQVTATVTYQGATLIVAARAPYTPSPAIVDLASAMIVVPSTPTLAGDTLTWTEQGSGAPDTVLAEFRNPQVQRIVVAPYLSGSLRVPRLPAAHAAFDLTAADVAAVALAKVTGGFDAVRARVFAGGLVPMDGTATIASASGGTAPTP